MAKKSEKRLDPNNSDGRGRVAQTTPPPAIASLYMEPISGSGSSTVAGRPYDEQVYLKSLQRHGSPLWLAVMSRSTQEAHG